MKCEHEWENGDVYAPIADCPYCRIMELEKQVEDLQEISAQYYNALKELRESLPKPIPLTERQVEIIRDVRRILNK